MKGDDVAPGVDQRAGSLLDAAQQIVEYETVGAGHAQARDMGGHACGKRARHLLLDHPVRGRNDQPDPRGHCHVLAQRFSRKPARSRRGSTSSQKNGSSSM
jgi:hypothetical protein